jgi:hypothetical protein
MRRLVALFAMLGVIATSVLAQSTKQRVVELYPGVEYGSAIVIPAGSKLELLPFKSDMGPLAEFRGQFTLSGTYLVDSYDPETGVTFWPDKKSRNALPYWQERDRPSEIYLTNGTAFADAVLPQAKLRMVKAGTLSNVRGRVTIIADSFSTSIECDVANYSARFVMVVMPDRQIAAIPSEDEGC